ncbi:MAG: DUF1624 domain-containing protein [Bacteroidetes bacterium]|nr:DUF1624 domain-containing protein [Bacteroidota bacterium]
MTAPTTASNLSSTKRIGSIDLLRGTVMIIMAIDHIRDYFNREAFLFSPTDLSQTTAPLFFTRWITHFCAPVFIFLAGVSAFLYGLKHTKKQLSRFLLTRGLWLILLEQTVLVFGWTFNIHFPLFIVIIVSAIGTGMICLSGFIYLSKRIILIIALLLIFGHNALDNIHIAGDGFDSILWSWLHESRLLFVGHKIIFLGYPVLPWIGVMAAGYILGSMYAPDFNAARRKKMLIRLGLSAIALFIVLRFSNIYGDPSLWTSQKTSFFSFLSFLNTTKYPPSLLYLLMTIGPALLFLAYTEQANSTIAKKISAFGRVPMFYYIVHIYLLHALAVVAVVVSGRSASDMVLQTWLGFDDHLKGYGFGLGVTYIIWIFLIIVLYPICKWYDNYKRKNLPEKKWLSYI